MLHIKQTISSYFNVNIRATSHFTSFFVWLVQLLKPWIFSPRFLFNLMQNPLAYLLPILASLQLKKVFTKKSRLGPIDYLPCDRMHVCI